LLVEREKEFSFNPDIVIDYPAITEQFLQDPVSYITGRIASIKAEQGRVVDEVVILTTYGNKLIGPLSCGGYVAEKIDMPAGPDHTYKFSKTVCAEEASSPKLCKLYLEAVNEQDEKIQPTFVLKLTDSSGKLIGGMCGSICEASGDLFAYIATVVVDKSAPKSTGSLLATTVLDYLKQQGVKCANLGTQTAGQFYEKHGFHVLHHIVGKLRSRVAKGGGIVHNDLVIMAKTFPDC